MNPTPVISKIFTFTSFCFTKFPHCANHSGMINFELHHPPTRGLRGTTLVARSFGPNQTYRHTTMSGAGGC